MYTTMAVSVNGEEIGRGDHDRSTLTEAMTDAIKEWDSWAHEHNDFDHIDIWTVDDFDGSRLDIVDTYKR